VAAAGAGENRSQYHALSDKRKGKLYCKMPVLRKAASAWLSISDLSGLLAVAGMSGRVTGTTVGKSVGDAV